MKEEYNYFDEKTKSWRDKNNKRMCTFHNDTIRDILNNCLEFLEKRDTLYIGDICVLLEKALEGVEDKNDLSSSEIDDIKRIRNKIKGL